MDQAEYLELHANCIAAKRAYFAHAETTAGMLAKCSAEPLSFQERLGLISQEIIESDAHAAYMAPNAYSTLWRYVVTGSQTEDHPLNHCSCVPRLVEEPPWVGLSDVDLPRGVTHLARGYIFRPSFLACSLHRKRFK